LAGFGITFIKLLAFSAVIPHIVQWFGLLGVGLGRVAQPFASLCIFFFLTRDEGG
jgi:hypothetical protein